MIEEIILINLMGFLLWYTVVLIRKTNNDIFAFETACERIEQKEAELAYYTTLLARLKIEREALELNNTIISSSLED